MESFSITANLTTYNCTISRDWMILVEEGSDTPLQSIPISDYELFITSPVYLRDVNFDGSDDLLFPYERAASYVTFDAYLWDPEADLFVRDDSFCEIRNPAIDQTDQCICSTVSRNQSVSHLVFQFEEGAFVCTHSLY